MKRRNGFTLVEMMVSVAIMAILLAAAAPSFQTFITNAKIRTTADTIQAGLGLARNEALRRNTKVTFWLMNGVTSACARSGAGTSWVVSLADPATKCNVASSETVAPQLIQSRAGSDGSTNVTVSAVDSAASASSCVTFNGFGRVETTCLDASSPITRFVMSSAGGTTLEVRVVSGGSTRMCNPAVGDTDPAYCGA